MTWLVLVSLLHRSRCERCDVTWYYLILINRQHVNPSRFLLVKLNLLLVLIRSLSFVIKQLDEGTKERPYPHAVIAGIERYPRKSHSVHGSAFRSKVKPCPTRYGIELDGLEGTKQGRIDFSSLRWRYVVVTSREQTPGLFFRPFGQLWAGHWAFHCPSRENYIIMYCMASC